jgi:hypothetical protein
MVKQSNRPSQSSGNEEETTKEKEKTQRRNDPTRAEAVALTMHAHE